MYHIKVRRTFSAAHALIIQSTRETLHGHDWQLTITLAGPTLDDDGLLVDFHTIETAIDTIIAPFHNANLNDLTAFTNQNPSAENVVTYIAQTLAPHLPPTVTVHSVAVTEAPGCKAVYLPD